MEDGSADLGLAIALAGEGDVEGILALQDRNQPGRGGALAASLPRARILSMLRDLPLIVARRGDRVVGFLLTASKPQVADVPVVQAMLAAYGGAADAYVYGPIVVDESERGRGVAQRMFAALKERLPGREGVLLIRADNAPSLRAHEKMGARPRGTFIHNGFSFFVLSYLG